LTKPTADRLAAIAKFYNQERLTQLGTATTATTADQIEQWLLTCGQAIRSYLYPTLLSADARLSPEGDAFLDSFESTFQESTLSSVIEEEEALSRQDHKSQLNAVLLHALVKLDLAAQRLLQAYYGQGLTQQELAKQMGVKQYTISRRLTSIRNGLLQVLAGWSQNALHQTLDSDVLSSMSNILEEWLKVHYSHPDLPS
jgi:RNA polymerase sigma factor (sigma-70 family)